MSLTHLSRVKHLRLIQLIPILLFLGAQPKAEVWADPSPNQSSTDQTAVTKSETSNTKHLDQLLADYRAFGLPLPPVTAQLTLIKESVGEEGGRPIFSYDIAFHEVREKKHFFWAGCAAVKSWLQPSEFEVITDSTPDLLVRIAEADPEHRSLGFGTDPYLALAIQCHSRGMTAYTAALLQRSHVESPWYKLDYTRHRPKDDRAAVAAMAWNYWCDEFVRSKGDRQAIANRLHQLRDSKMGLDTPDKRNIIQDMEQTLTASTSAPGSLDETIDSFIDLGGQHDPADDNFASLSQTIRFHGGYQKLRAAGLDAVPTLIQHIKDFRITRCIEHLKEKPYHARIADVVAHILNELVTEKFAYDLLQHEGRGICLDQAHVLYWWTAARKTEPIEFILSQAITRDPQGKYLSNGAMLHILGQRAPDQLVKLFEEHLSHLDNSVFLFDALESSKVSAETRDRLLLSAAGNSDRFKRRLAIHHLLKLKHANAVPLLLKELEALPKTPQEDYWLSGTAELARQAHHTDDEQVWTALTRTAQRVDVGQRLEVLQGIGKCGKGNVRAIGFLAQFLSDTEVRDKGDVFRGPYSGPGAGFIFKKLAVRDFAALQLARQLDVPQNPDPVWKEEQWTAFRAQVSAALAECQSVKQQNRDDK